MNPWPVEAEVPEVHLPRPGHADLVGAWKYGFTDVRNVLERASARETAARVAGGAVCRAYLAALGVEIRSHVVQIGTEHAVPREGALTVSDFDGVDDDPVRCLDPDASRAMVQHINVQRKANESIGGVFEVIVFGVVPGLGSHVSWEERLDGRLAQAICSIQAVKGVTLGEAFEIAAKPGSEAHDEIFYSDERGYHRETNRAGGLEGGMTTGEPLLVRGAMKPLPTLTQPLRSVDISTREPAQALRERTDSSTVPGGRRRRRGDGRVRRRGRLPREVRRRPRRRHARGGRSAYRASGSGGGRGPRPLSRLRRLHGSREDDLRRRGCAAARRPRPRRRRGPHRRVRRAHRGLLGTRGRTGVPRARGAGRPGGPGRRSPRSSRSAAARSGPSACARPCGRTPSCSSRSTSRPPGHASRAAAGRSRATAPPSTRSTRRAGRPTTPPRTRRCRARARTSCGARCRRCTALASGEAEGLRLLWATSASGDYPVWLGAGAIAAPWPLAADLTALRRQRRARRGPLRRPRAAARRARGDRRGGGAEDAHDRRGGVARAREPGRDARRPPRGRRRRRRRRPRGLLRCHVPARDPRRPGADDARRTGRLGLRREDRRRPPRGQELRRAPTTSRRRCSSTRRRSRRCPRRSSPPDTPRSSRRR